MPEEPPITITTPANISPRPVRFIGLLASLLAAAILVLENAPQGLPQHELVFGFMVYLLGPGGLTVAVLTLVPRQSWWLFPLAATTYLAFAALFIIFAVNVGAIAP